MNTPPAIRPSSGREEHQKRKAERSQDVKPGLGTRLKNAVEKRFGQSKGGRRRAKIAIKGIGNRACRR